MRISKAVMATMDPLERERMRLRAAYNNGDRSPEARAAVAAGVNRYTHSTTERRGKRRSMKQHDKAMRRVRDRGGVMATDAVELRAMKAMYFDVWMRNHSCGWAMWSVDHIIAVIDGGSHTLDNLQIMLLSDNTAKENRSRSQRKNINHVSTGPFDL